jgi:Nuclease-related domain
MSADEMRVWLRDIRACAIGSLGEALVRAELEGLGWPMLRNVVLLISGASVEIDHLACAPGAIVVLETKTYSGEVDGHPASECWQLRLRDGRCFGVPNALRQNAAHLLAVRRAVNDDAVRVRGYVVSAGAGQFAPTLAATVLPLRELGRRLVEDLAIQGREAERLLAAWSRLVASAAEGERYRSAHAARISRRV